MSDPLEAPMFELQLDSARRLASLVSVHQDVDFAISCLERLQTQIGSTERDVMLETCLWSSALVAYCRCFAEGKRHGLSEKLFLNLPGDALGVHRYMKKM